MPIQIKFLRMAPSAILPTRGTHGAAGLDLYSVETRVLCPGEWALISTAIQIEIPPGYEGQVRPRSGLARDHGITVLNSPGTIDADYRGEILVNLYMVPGRERGSYKVRAGDRIAQLVVAPVERAEPMWVEDLSPSLRGSGGWGSTGR